MLQRPWFKPHLTVRVVEDEGVLFLTETDHFSLQGKLYEMVASAIDGVRTTSQIVNQLHGKASEKEVQETIGELEKRGLLIESTNSIPANEAAFWWMQDIDPQTTLQRFENDSLSIQTFGKISVEPFVEAIRSFGIRIADEGRFGVVLTDDYLSSGLADYNDQSLNGDRSWMLIKPVGCEIWIGPLFVPGRTGCWECLAYRLRSNRNAETFLRFHKNQSQRESVVVSTAFTPVTLNIAWNLAAARVAKWIVQEELPELEGQIFVQKILTGESDIHKMVWRPQCPACGDPVEEVPQDIQPLLLQSTKKIFTVDGGHRVTTPDVTLEKYEHHISPITGIVKKMDRYGVTKAGALHVYGGSVNCVIGYEGIKSINDVMTSSGKGASDAQARTSALCESLDVIPEYSPVKNPGANQN